MEYLRNGLSGEELLSLYPSLPPSAIHAALELGPLYTGPSGVEGRPGAAEGVRRPVRDYADLASMQKLAIEHGVSVVVVRPPKAEAGACQRPAAIADIVHRHLPRIVSMYGD